MVNATLEDILRTGEMEKDGEIISLHSNMDADEGELIDRAMRAAKPKVSLEVGCAYGISTLFACAALSEVSPGARHIVIDPNQTVQWKGLGVENARRAGFGNMVELIEQGSEVAIPALHASGLRIQAAIIDGWHTFDHAMVDFFFVNKMLDVGGIVVLDDTNWPALNRLYNLVLSYPAFELFGECYDELGGSPVKRLRRAARRSLGRATGLDVFERPEDYPRCAAFRKIGVDDRNWDWHHDF